MNNATIDNLSLRFGMDRCRWLVRAVLTTFAVLVLFSSGCTKEQDIEYDPEKDPLVNPAEMFQNPPADRSQIATDESIIISYRSGASTMNPLFTSSGYDNYAVGLVFEGMFYYDTDLVIHTNPNVVEKLVESDDHLTIDVYLKQGMKWQDGHPLNAQDFVFTMEMLKKESVPCYTYKSEAAHIDSVKAIDDYHLQYKLTQPIATRLDLIGMPGCPVPKHLFEKEMVSNPDLKTGDYYQKLAMNPVGNGPYKLIEWVENEKLVFERWEDYPGEKPYLKRIVFRIQPDITIALLSFKSGDIDVLDYVSGKQCALETNDEKFVDKGYKYVMPEWIYDYTGWNMDGSNPFFIDKRVRQAMAHVDNFELINHKLAYNMLTPCYGIFHPTSWMFNHNIQRFEYDLERAATLLDEAGWKVESDGWRYRQGRYVLLNKEITDQNTGDKRIEPKKIFLLDDQEYTLKEGETLVESGIEKRKFEFTLLSTSSDGLPRPSATIYQMDLRKLGIDMKIRLMEWTSFMNRVLQHDMQAWGAAWGAGTDPDGSKGSLLTKDYNDGRNYGGYSNPEVDELFDKGMIEFDQQKRAAIYARIQGLVYEDQPYLFHDNRLSVSAVHKRIKGIERSSMGFCSLYPGFLKLWVPKGQELRPVKSE